MRRRLVRYVAVTGLCAALAACGANAPGAGGVAPSERGASALPVTVTSADGVESTVTDASRILPVNGDIAEVVFALGLGDQVVATDVSATHPPRAAALPKIGYQRTLAAEPILAFEPTLVVGTTDAGPPEVIGELRAVGVPVVLVEAATDLDAPAAKIRAVAQALGVPERGEALAAEVEEGIAKAITDAEDRLAGRPRPRVAFLYLRGDSVRALAGAGSGIDALIAAAGGTNVGTELGIEDFEPLSDEAIVAAAPGVLVVTTSGLESVGGMDGLLSIPALARTPAGADRRVLVYEDQLLLGLGPRTHEILALLARDLHAAPAAGALP